MFVSPGTNERLTTDTAFGSDRGRRNQTKTPPCPLESNKGDVERNPGFANFVNRQFQAGRRGFESVLGSVIRARRRPGPPGLMTEPHSNSIIVRSNAWLRRRKLVVPGTIDSASQPLIISVDLPQMVFLLFVDTSNRLLSTAWWHGSIVRLSTVALHLSPCWK